MEEEKHSQKKYFLAGLITVGALIVIAIFLTAYFFITQSNSKLQFKSIDTMKFSRDLAREKLNDPSFDKTIDLQIKNIAQTGATHVGIATPYDEEFVPILKRWVAAARKHNLKVWFRGNFSGWEGWFGYPKISREEHLEKTKEFIFRQKALFENGDAFTGCPECENGGPGDPRRNGDVVGHRKFLVDQYKTTQQMFKNIDKKVTSNYESMNYDVAKLVMDRQTTKSIGGVVTIDHYVKSPQQLNHDINELAKNTGGKIVLGEFGVPIPDINGQMSSVEQYLWLQELFSLIKHNRNLIGLSYWVNAGGSTQIWNNDNTPRNAVVSITQFYQSH